MSFKELLQSLPTVAAPGKQLGFKEKIKWTTISLVTFFILGEITLFGIATGATGDIFGELRVIMASKFGTIVTLGIGPIVMGSIILQLLAGAGVLKFDMTSDEGKKIYYGAQKWMSILFTLFEGGILVLSGQLAPSSALIASQGALIANIILITQILLGGLIIIYLDEIVAKWGFGSGISLFIAAGVSYEIVLRAFDPMRLGAGQPINGAIPAFIQSFTQGSIQFIRQYPNDMLALLATVVVFIVTMYAQTIKVEVPISYGRISGLSRRYPLPFVYASNMPVIFLSALLANFRFWIAILQKTGVKIFGYFDPSGAAHGAISYVLPYTSFLKDLFFHTVGVREIIHASTYFIVMIIGSILFSKLWVSVSGMTAGDLAGKLTKAGLQIPGFRSDPRVVEQVLSRYVPYLTILGGAFVGGLAAIADMSNALAGGTGVLLTVGIIYHLYQQIASDQLMELNPMIRNFIGDGGLV